MEKMEDKDFLSAIKEVAKDEAFMEELAETESETAFTEKLATKGIEVTPEEASYLYKAVMRAQSGEIGEDDLEDVAGGFLISGTALALTGIAAGAAFLIGAYQTFRCKKSKKR